MDEDPSYRPKIFHSSGVLMGQEQEFPEPNNTRRKLRSIACARQIGKSSIPPTNPSTAHPARPDTLSNTPYLTLLTQWPGMLMAGSGLFPPNALRKADR